MGKLYKHGHCQYKWETIERIGKNNGDGKKTMPIGMGNNRTGGKKECQEKLSV